MFTTVKQSQINTITLFSTCSFIWLLTTTIIRSIKATEFRMIKSKMQSTGPHGTFTFSTFERRDMAM